jgi:molecular chaperone Hsp33
MPFQSGDAPEGASAEVQEDDNWVKGRLLLDTAEDHELLDPQLSPQRLLYRLYHEDGVTVYPEIALHRYCSCSREGITAMLKRFPPEDRQDMVSDGQILVTCEFCSTPYGFDPAALEGEIKSP